jgi:hypothetical protein
MSAFLGRAVDPATETEFRPQQGEDVQGRFKSLAPAIPDS